MSNSDTLFAVTVTFEHTPPEGFHLALTDGRLQSLIDGEHQSLQLQLPKGVYHLKATFIDYFEEYFLQVTQDEHFSFNFKYPSTAPILNFATTHEYFSDPAEQFSIQPTSGQEKPNFLFYAAAYDKNYGADLSGDQYEHKQMIADVTQHFTVFSSDGPNPILINTDSAYIDREKGVVAFSTQLAPGQYFLKYDKAEATRIFPLHIYDGYQTQFFIRYWLQPDFANCFFYFSEKLRFESQAMEYLVLDRLQFAFKEICNYQLLSEQDLHIIKNSPYLLSLVRILHLATSKDHAEFEKNMLPFATAGPMLPLPDIAILESLHDNKFLEYSDQLPLIGGIMAKCLAVQNNVMQYLPGSLMDRIADHIQFDLFWNNFSLIESIEEMKQSYAALIEKSDYYLIQENENPIVKLTKFIANKVRSTPKDKQERRLNILLGENSEFLPKRFEMLVNSIGNVSEIAQKLNLPATTVMRNYKIYDDIFKDITK